MLVIAPPPDGAQAMTADAVDDLLRDRLSRDSVKDAVAHAVEVSGRPRREIYARALELAKQTMRRATMAKTDGSSRRPDKADKSRLARARRGVSHRSFGRNPRRRVF